VAAPTDCDHDECLSSGLGLQVLAALMTLASLAVFCFITMRTHRAKNCGHTSTLLLVGVLFGLTGYWIGGFAVQMGGVGDAHAAPGPARAPSGNGSRWITNWGRSCSGIIGALWAVPAFFLATDNPSRDGIAALFLIQAACWRWPLE